MEFIAFAPVGGQADYYWILQNNTLNITSKRLDIFPGYNSLNFRADEVGRHIILFVLNNQPSNAIIIDVISQAPPAQQTPMMADMPPSTNPPLPSATQATQMAQATQPVQMPTGVSAPGGGMQSYSATAQQTAAAGGTTSQQQIAATYPQPKPAGSAHAAPVAAAPVPALSTENSD